jgi:exonuclease III
MDYSSLNESITISGDMNVAASYRDGTHWEKRGSSKTQNETGSTGESIIQAGNNSDGDGGDYGGDVYEWFRDESKCLGKSEGAPLKLPENVGIPGFTPSERKRFAAFLEEGNFCDVWRKLHPQGVLVSDKKDDSDNKNSSSPWERPNYTWRGALAKNFGGYAKYQGKGQRIDYFLLSSKLGVQEIATCEIRGYGTNKEGLYCGSDHCAVELRFKSGS